MANQRESTLTPEVIFGRHMRRLRERHGWSQSVLADKLADFHDIELHFSAIAKMEGANRVVRLNEAVAIAEIFEVPLAEMLEVTGISMNHAELLALLEAEQRFLEAKLRHVEENKVRVGELVGDHEGTEWADMTQQERQEALREVAHGRGDPDVARTWQGRVVKGAAKVLGPGPAPKEQAEADDDG